jgi:hypothetical protein
VAVVTGVRVVGAADKVLQIPFFRQRVEKKRNETKRMNYSKSVVELIWGRVSTRGCPLDSWVPSSVAAWVGGTWWLVRGAAPLELRVAPKRKFRCAF